MIAHVIREASKMNIAEYRRNFSFRDKIEPKCLNCDAEGNKTSPEDLEKAYHAKIENLRRCDKLTCVRGAYHMFFNERGSTRETYPSRWKAAWDYVNYYFNLDLSGDGKTDQ